MPQPNSLPPDEKRPLQPLDVRRRREIKVYSEISRLATQNRFYMPEALKAKMAREIVGRLEKERELA